jgi:hypothetical protein
MNLGSRTPLSICARRADSARRSPTSLKGERAYLGVHLLVRIQPSRPLTFSFTSRSRLRRELRPFLEAPSVKGRSVSQRRKRGSRNIPRGQADSRRNGFLLKAADPVPKSDFVLPTDDENKVSFVDE